MQQATSACVLSLAVCVEGTGTASSLVHACLCCLLPSLTDALACQGSIARCVKTCNKGARKLLSAATSMPVNAITLTSQLRICGTSTDCYNFENGSHGIPTILLVLLVQDPPAEAAKTEVRTWEYEFLEPSLLEEEQNRVPPLVREVLFSRDRI